MQAIINVEVKAMLRDGVIKACKGLSCGFNFKINRKVKYHFYIDMHQFSDSLIKDASPITSIKPDLWNAISVDFDGHILCLYCGHQFLAVFQDL